MKGDRARARAAEQQRRAEERARRERRAVRRQRAAALVPSLPAPGWDPRRRLLARLAGAWLLVQLVVWQFLSSTPERLGAALLTAAALPLVLTRTR